MAQKGKVYTKKAIAQILELSEKRVEQLTKDGLIEEYSRGHYKLLPTIQGYMNYLRSQLSGGTDYNTEKAELTRLKREDAELELKLKRNELHRSADVEFIMTNMLIAFKAKLETLPYKVLSTLINIPEGKDKAEHFLETLKQATGEALKELSAYRPGDFTEYLIELEDVTGGDGE